AGVFLTLLSLLMSAFALPIPPGALAGHPSQAYGTLLYSVRDQISEVRNQDICWHASPDRRAPPARSLENRENADAHPARVDTPAGRRSSLRMRKRDSRFPPSS